MYRQEEEDEQAEAAAAGTGEDLCHPSAYNKETTSAVSLIPSRFSGRGYGIGHVCVSVCSSVSALTIEPFELQT